MTRFFCQELLFDYITGELTPERRAEVDAFLKTDDVCREDLARIKKAIGYCDQLAQIQTPEEWVARWQNLPPALAKRISNWEHRIVAKLWMALPYTVSVTVVVLGVGIFKPWRTLYRKDVVMWSASQGPAQSKATVTAIEPPSPMPVTEVAANPVPSPSTAPPPPTPTPPLANVPGKPGPIAQAMSNTHHDIQKAEQDSKDSLIKTEELGPPEKIEETVTTIFGPAREQKAVAVAAAPAPTNVPSAGEAADAAPEDKPSSLREAAKGELYRWFLNTDDLESVTSDIKQKIIALHGEKARKVELGWQSKNDESYFHFTLPESNENELATFIKTFGPVRMLKEKHPVVMPQGKMRIILIVKEDAQAQKVSAPANQQKDDAADGDDDEETEAPQVP